VHSSSKTASRSLGYGFSGRERPVQFSIKNRLTEFRLPYRVLMDEGDAMVQAARTGIGLAQVPDYMAADELARGTLVEVLTEFKPPPLPIRVVWPGNRLMPARVRAFIDVLADEN
jgi:DNA-binding transcriptional LysR family regulator